MTWFSDLLERTELASIASFIVVVGSLYISYKTSDEKTLGIILGASVTWLYYRKPNGNASL